MTPQQHRRARELFEAALEHEPADVVRWLADGVSEDPEVRAEVKSLLDHHSRAGAFLSQPIAEAAPHLLEEDRVLQPGTTLVDFATDAPAWPEPGGRKLSYSVRDLSVR